MEKDLLKNIALFKSLNESELEKLAQVAYLQKFSKDNIIFLEDDTGTNLFIIKKGKVKISKLSNEGKEVILSILKDGDSFGEMSLLTGEKRSANVTSIEKSELLILQRDDFLNLLNSYPQISIFLLKDLSKKLQNADAQIKRLSLFKAAGKVASAIIQLIETNGVTKNNKMVLKETPSRQDLANLAGISRENVSRVITMFTKEGLISKDGNKIIIENFEKFKKLYT